VGFFFQQYVEVMTHGKDRTDEDMKGYLFDVITQLGVPEAGLPAPLEPEELEPEPPVIEPANPAIIRRTNGRRFETN
jgi:hypothetical protein